ncbi:MAG: LamG domain-containing protein [bacterium]|nr:LamG domain-containing protein [bacterium]
MGILETLPVRDGLVLAYIPATRSLLDQSGLGHVLTVTGKWARMGGVDGHAAGSAGKVSTPHVADLSGFAGYACFVSGVFEPVANGVFVRKSGAGGRIHFYTTGTGQVAVYDGTTSSVLATDIRPLRSIGANVAGGAKPEFFGDGTSLGLGSGVVTVPATTLAMELLGPPSSVQSARALLFYNETKTADEWARLHAWSESLTSPVIPADRRYFDLGSMVPHGGEGVIGAWDARDVTKRTLPDRSGAGNDGTLEGPVAPVNTDVGRALRFDGAASYVSVSAGWESLINGSGEFTFSTLVRIPAFNAHNHRLFSSSEGNNLAITVTSAGAIQVFLKTALTAWVAVASSTGVFAEDAWQLVTVTYSSGALKIYIDETAVIDSAVFSGGLSFLAQPLVFGSNSATNNHWLEGEMQRAIIEGYAITPEEVARRYQPIARQVLYYFDPEQVPPTLQDVGPGQTIPGTDYRVESGSFAVEEVAAPGKVLVADRDGELTDGDMEAIGTTAWTISGDGNPTKEPGSPGGTGTQVLRITRVTTNYTFAFQASLELGKTYRAIGLARGDGTSPPLVRLGGVTVWTGTASTSWQAFDVTAVASVDTWFRLYHYGAVAGWCEYDDVQVYKVQPDRKGIVCKTAGVYSRPKPLVPGTDEIEILKGGASNITNVLFMASIIGDRTTVGQYGYAIAINNSEAVLLAESSNGASSTKLASVTSYVAINTRYRFRVTRTSAGTFTLYIKGGGFEDWTLVTANTGSNPVTDTTTTTANYEVYDLDVGDIHFLDTQYRGPVAP